MVMQRTLRAAAVLFLIAGIAQADAWSELMRGNRRYVAGRLVYSHLAAERRALRNTQPGSVAELRQQARREFRRLARRTAELEGFFRHVGLSVN